MLYGNETWCLREKNKHLEKNRKNNAENTEWCQSSGQKKHGTHDGYVAMKSNHRYNGQRKWSEMAGTCFEKMDGDAVRNALEFIVEKP